MYEFKPVTKRVLDYRNAIRDRVLTFDMDRIEIYTRAYEKYGNMLPILRKAYAHYDYCQKCDIFIGEGELIVGSRGHSLFATPQYPEWGLQDWYLDLIDKGEWTLGDDGSWHNPPTDPFPQVFADKDYERMKQLREYWRDKKCGVMADAWKPDYYAELERLEVSSYRPGGVGLVDIPLGHLVAGYKKIITKGYKAIRQEAQLWLDGHYDNIQGEDVRKYTFYKAAVISCDGAMLLCRRYGDACKAKRDECTDPKRKAELAEMAENLYWIAENPVKTFWQACQAIMMYQLFYTMETSNPSAAFGRFDQYVWPYLQSDLKDGRMTRDFAQEIIDMFFLKAECFFNAGPAIVADTAGVGNTWQHTTLGGVDPVTGEDAANPVTYMVLETVGRLELHDPTISLRFNKNTPKKQWDCAIATSKLVGGLPLYQNDEVIVPGLMKTVGFELRDARDYGIIGCQEIVGCGCDYPAPNGAHPPHAAITWTVVLDMAINNGINPINGQQSSVKTGYLYEMTSIEQVREAYKKMAVHVMNMFTSTHNYAEHISQYMCPQPALSISMEGCMEKGADVAWGGCKYNSYGSTATGLATVSDSITAIKYMCFDKKLCTTRQLYDAVMANWEGYEQLRQLVLNQVPHFGNNDPYADIELKWVIDLYCEMSEKVHSTRSKVYKPGLYGASDHIRQGHDSWATPDGRVTGEPIADAISPAQGRDKFGPTAIFASSLVYDQSRFMDGVALNIRLHPSVVSNDEGVSKLAALTKAYFENGGLEVQYNIVDTATLIKAQQDPASYKNLVVRIAGYSAYFIELGEELQNDIIRRSENTAM